MFSISLEVIPDEVPLWEALHQISLQVPVESWGVFGGQMVRLHAAMESVVFPRTTRDLDLGVDVRGHTREAMKKMAATLIAMGFSIETSIDGVSRFRKDDIAIDLLAPEGMGSEQVSTAGSAYAIQAPGLSQAFNRMITVEVHWNDKTTVIRTPSIIGAFISKAAACTEILSLTTDELLRHQQDLLFLSSLTNRHNLYEISARLTSTDRRRITKALDPIIANKEHRAWSTTQEPVDIEQTVTGLTQTSDDT